MTAKRAELELLHDVFTLHLLELVKEGVPVYDGEGKMIYRNKANTALFAVVSKFLHQNDVKALPVAKSHLVALKAALPDFEDSIDDVIPDHIN